MKPVPMLKNYLVLSTSTRLVVFAINAVSLYLILPKLGHAGSLIVKNFAFIILAATFLCFGVGNAVLLGKESLKKYCRLSVLYAFSIVVIAFIDLESRETIQSILMVSVTFIGFQVGRVYFKPGLFYFLNLLFPPLLLLDMSLWEERLLSPIFAIFSLMILLYFHKKIDCVQSENTADKTSLFHAFMISVLEACRERLPVLFVASEVALLLAQLMPVLGLFNMVNQVASWMFAAAKRDNLHGLVKVPIVYSVMIGISLTVVIFVIDLILKIGIASSLYVLILLFVSLGLFEFNSGPKKAVFLKSRRFKSLYSAQLSAIGIMCFFGYFFGANIAMIAIATVFLLPRWWYVFFLNINRAKRF